MPRANKENTAPGHRIPTRLATCLQLLAACFMLGTAPAGSALAADCNFNNVDDSGELDSDGDGTIDACDNCRSAPNADQRDSNGDGFGNVCDADLSNDGQINFVDLGMLKSVFFSSDPDADLNGDGAVNFTDLGAMKAQFFTAPGPGANETPVADAGSDVVTLIETDVNLDGSGSSDATGDALSYQWEITSKPGGANAQLLNANTPMPTLKPDSVGTWTVSLTVNDGVTDSAVDSVTVTAQYIGALPSNATWMSDIEPQIASKRLRDLVIPGTHDSATYAIASGSPVARDCYINLPDTACLIAGGLPGVAKAQGFDIYGQLTNGIRYLDLRLCEERDSSGIYSCHSLQGSPIEEVLDDIDRFLSRTEREIVIVDYRFFYGFEDVDHNYLIDAMRTRFGNAMVSEEDLMTLAPALPGGTALERMQNITVDWMWQNNKRLIVGYGKENNDRKCANDDVKSMRLEHLDAGTELWVYDSAPPSTTDDYLYVRVKQDIDYRDINTLEASFEDAQLEVVYNAVNGLNGKVSSFQSVTTVLGDDASALVRFYKDVNTVESDLDCQYRVHWDELITRDFTESQSDGELRDPYPLEVPANSDIWKGGDIITDDSFANTTDIGTLVRKANTVLPNTRSKMHLLQGQFTPGTGDILAGNANLFDLAQQSNEHIPRNLRDHWKDDNVNLIMIDWFEFTDLVQYARNINAESNPAGIAGYHLFEEHDAGDGEVQMKGDTVCRGSLAPPFDVGTLTFTQSATCDNDSADSVVFYDLQPGQVVRIFDDSAGTGSSAAGISQDDWIEMEVLQKTQDVIFDTLENVDLLTQENGPDNDPTPGIYNNGEIRVVRHGTGNINDRVSRMEWGYEATGGVVDFMSGVIGTGDLLCSVPVSSNLQFDFTQNALCNNDAAQSMVLYDVPAGTFMRIYDSSSGATNDDWAQIWVKQDIDRYVINSLDADIDDSSVEMIVLRDNGLGGKVSRFEFDTQDILAAAPPTVEFFYDNGGYGEVQCVIPEAILDLVDVFPGPIFYEPQSFGCNNDDIRSLVFRNVPAGFTIQLCDASDCSNNDDISVTTVLQSDKYHRVDTFEATYNDGVVSQQYFEDNGLDGKVSAIILD
ncbi:MAG: hypothetical protein AAFN78_13915 [Pseudomonadota bacterium]